MCFFSSCQYQLFFLAKRSFLHDTGRAVFTLLGFLTKRAVRGSLRAHRPLTGRSEHAFALAGGLKVPSRGSPEDSFTTLSFFFPATASLRRITLHCTSLRSPATPLSSQFECRARAPAGNPGAEREAGDTPHSRGFPSAVRCYRKVRIPATSQGAQARCLFLRL
jgi:hypothetical protein